DVNAMLADAAADAAALDAAVGDGAPVEAAAVEAAVEEATVEEAAVEAARENVAAEAVGEDASAETAFVEDAAVAEEGAPQDSALPNEWRMIEAMLFAATGPLGAKELAARLPDGADVRALLSRLQMDYAMRGVNLVCVAGKWTFRTANDLSWLLS